MKKLVRFNKEVMKEDNDKILIEFGILMSQESWSSYQIKIFKEIYRYVNNNENISHINREMGMSENFYNFLIENVITYLYNNTILLDNLTEKQIEKVKKYSLAIFLMTRNPPYIRNQISTITHLHPETIEKIIIILDLKILKNVQNRSQIFDTLSENARFLNEILDSGLRNKLLLASRQGPTKIHLIENGYQQFIYAVERNKQFKYSDILKKADLLPYTHPDFTPLFIEKFCRTLIIYIKKLRKKVTDKNPLISTLLQDNTFNIILTTSKIPKSRTYISRAKICLKVVVFALLKCSCYTSLSKEIQLLTEKTERTVRRYIIEFIPLLNVVMGLDISNWLPHPYREYSFNDVLEIVNNKGFFLISPSDERQYEILKRQTKGGTHRIYITVHCGNPNHLEYQVRFDTILYGGKCKYCTGYTITLYDIKELLEIVGLRKTGRSGVLINPSDEKEFEELKSEYDLTPAIIPLEVYCGNPTHPPWISQYHYIQSGYWCTLCGDRYTAVGNLIHLILEYLTLTFIKNKKCYAINEFNTTPNRGFAVDIAILRENNFKDSIEKNQKIIISIDKKIRLVCIDFTLSTSLKAIKTKFYKNYQATDRLLIIVLLLEEENNDTIISELYSGMNSLTNVLYKKNIKFIDYSQYLEFLGLIPTIYNITPLSRIEKSIQYQFRNSFKLMKKALLSDTDFELGELKKKSDNYKERLIDLRNKELQYFKNI